MKEILVENISSNPLKVDFDFATVLQYEEDHKEELSLLNSTTLSAQVKIIYSIFRAANEWFVMPFKEFAHKFTLDDLKSVDKDVTEALMKFYNIPDLAENADGESASENEDEGPNV